MAISDKIKVKRNPKRGAYDKDSLYAILATLEKEISQKLNKQEWSIGHLDNKPVVSLLICTFQI
jgi:hypothetical protein